MQRSEMGYRCPAALLGLAGCATGGTTKDPTAVGNQSRYNVNESDNRNEPAAVSTNEP